MLDMLVASGVHAILRTSSIFDTRIHMVQTKPRYPAQLPRVAGLHSSMATMGAHVIQLGGPWHDS